MLLSRKWLNEFVPVEAKDRAFAEDMTPLRLQGGGYRGRGEISKWWLAAWWRSSAMKTPITCGFVRWMWEKALPSNCHRAQNVSRGLGPGGQR